MQLLERVTVNTFVLQYPVLNINTYIDPISDKITTVQKNIYFQRLLNTYILI